MMALTVWYDHISSDLTAEALAMQAGVKIAAAGEFTKLVVETDSLSLVNLWKTRRDHSASEIQELSRGHCFLCAKKC